MRLLRMAVVALGVLAAVTPVSAGWIIDEVVRGGNDTHQQRMFLQGNRLKTVSLEGERVTQAVVMDLDAQTITQIDYKERAYTTATAKEYADALREGMKMMGEAMGGQMQSQLKDMEEQLKQLPPEQRKQIEAMMRQAQQSAQPPAAPKLKPEDCAPDTVDIKRTGKSVTVAGYDASGYQIFTNGKLDSEVWIAPAITAVREIDPQKLERMVGEMMKALPQCPPKGQMFGADPVWKLMKDGYPVRSVAKDGGTVTEVVKAESRSLGAGEFQPPAGFARKSLKEMMGGK
jgi:Spy/CpxP family protein refolding chaperone